jgi:hypothetical protein
MFVSTYKRGVKTSLYFKQIISKNKNARKILDAWISLLESVFLIHLFIINSPEFFII